jgi:sn-glycerol 3-phosphate transport system permease protein
MQFFRDCLLPLSTTTIAALFVIQFIYGWNQYLWPLLITTDRNLTPIVVGVTQMISRSGDAATAWNLVMATVVLAMIPPAVIVVLMQRWFVKGLIETEK